MSDEQPTIIYTLTDEAPLLATYAFLPIIRTFAEPAGINVETSDISVAARILAEFSDYLTEEQRVPDNLAELGELTQLPGHQHHQAAEHQRLGAAAHGRHQGTAGQGLRDSGLSRSIRRPTRRRTSSSATARCLGSAVNPVLREGNSDRRAPKAVKEYARKHPHSMGEWSQASRTHVATMKHGDFYHGEKSMTLDRDAQGADGAGDQERRDDRAQARGRRWTTATSSTACS